MSISIGSRLVPSLLVHDLSATIQFYGRLGFKLTGAYPSVDAPEWAEVSRDGISLQFFVDPPVGTPPNPILSGALYLHPTDVAGLAKEFSEVVEFAWGPEVMDYGMFEFAIRDPNGYFLAFTEPTD